jgi:hypothetical protein
MPFAFPHPFIFLVVAFTTITTFIVVVDRCPAVNASPMEGVSASVGESALELHGKRVKNDWRN